MRRTMDVSVPGKVTEAPLAQLQWHEQVMGLSVSRRTSIKPSGDVITQNFLALITASIITWTPTDWTRPGRDWNGPCYTLLLFWDILVFDINQATVHRKAPLV